MTDVSIVIVSWNVRNELENCLQSILDTVDDLKVEIYVVDNDSSDGTCEMVRANYSNVHLIRNSANVGFARANNQGILLSTGRYVLLLNPDTVVYTMALENMVRFMDSHPNVAACSCKILDEKEEVFRYRTKRLTLIDELLRDTIFGKLLSPFGKWTENIDYNRTQKVERVPGTCLMVKRKTIERVGMLDERYFLYVEDDDWCRRMDEAGDIFLVGNATIMHLQARSSEQVEENAWLVGTHARFMFYQKYYGFMLTLVVRVIVLCSAVISFLKWKGISSLDSHNKAVRHKLMVYRTCIQACLGIGKRVI